MKLLIKKWINKSHGDLSEECFIPMRDRRIKHDGRWNLVQEKLIPGYVFIVTIQPEEVFHSLKVIPHLTKLLGADDGFTPLTDHEVVFLKRFGDKDHLVHLSEAIVEAANQVRILSGNLKNYEGEVIKVNLHKRSAIVRISFMGATTDIYLGIDIVEKKD